MGPGYYHLGAVLWTVLLRCLFDNDIHSAKIIMMLSQTFYRIDEKAMQKTRKTQSTLSSEGIIETEKIFIKSEINEDDAKGGDGMGGREKMGGGIESTPECAKSNSEVNDSSSQSAGKGDADEDEEEDEEEITRIEQRKVCTAYFVTCSIFSPL